MYALKANFYPAQEPKAGYVGKADITVGNTVRLNNISVFKNEQDGTYSIAFAKFGNDNDRSFVIPSSKEAFAAMVEVVGKAVEAEKHFAAEKGDLGVKLEVNGARVNEQFADGRFSVKVGDFCTLNGISTREVEYARDGKDESFVAVDFPPVRDAEGNVSLYTDKKGNQRANLQFEGLKVHYTKEGKEMSTDYQALMSNMIRKHRDELGKTLDATIEAADSKKEQRGEDNFVPGKEQIR